MNKNNPIKIVVHHTGGIDSDPKFDTSNQTFEVVDEYHRQKWNFKSSLGYYIGYHYFIDKTGKIKQGRLDTDEGAHTIGENLQSIGVCLAGNFDVTMPTDAQIATLKAFLDKKMKEYAISIENIFPHRHYANKSCYGNRLSDDWARNLVINRTQSVEPCVNEKTTIELQKKQISNLQLLIQTIINFFKK